MEIPYMYIKDLEEIIKKAESDSPVELYIAYKNLMYIKRIFEIFEIKRDSTAVQRLLKVEDEIDHKIIKALIKCELLEKQACAKCEFLEKQSCDES